MRASSAGGSSGGGSSVGSGRCRSHGDGIASHSAPNPHWSPRDGSVVSTTIGGRYLRRRRARRAPLLLATTATVGIAVAAAKARSGVIIWLQSGGILPAQRRLHCIGSARTQDTPTRQLGISSERMGVGWEGGERDEEVQTQATARRVLEHVQDLHPVVSADRRWRSSTMMTTLRRRPSRFGVVIVIHILLFMHPKTKRGRFSFSVSNHYNPSSRTFGGLRMPSRCCYCCRIILRVDDAPTRTTFWLL